MYWLIGVFILTAMLAVLAVASNTALPDSALLFSISDFSLMPLSLIIVTIVLIIITQRSAVASVTAGSSFPHHSSFILRSSFKPFRYLLLIILASMLIVGSGWQALNHHQQAEATAITEPMRVQAWVTIEGISDSVYDSDTNSGYRQVAILRAISPLLSELSAEDLNAKTLEHINNNSLSNKGVKNKKYRVLLNAYPKKSTKSSPLATINELQPGAQLLMTLTLAPVATSEDTINNPSGFDSYRWLRARHIDGVANIIAIGSPVDAIQASSMLMPSSDSYLHRMRVTIDQWRWQLRQHFYQDWAQQTTAQQQAKAVTLSLLTGDRSLINHETKDLYQLAGISHLLAISGTHVLFSAIMLAGLVTLLMDKRGSALYRTIPRWQVRWWVMIGAAFIYALFTGFDVPAARTAWMLLAVGAVRLTLLPISTIRVLLALAIVMAWVDPYVLWQAGYWLSFIAVALLLKYDDGRQVQAKLSTQHQRQHDFNTQHSKMNVMRTKIWALFKRIFKLQFWLFIALLPITLLLFGKVSLWGLVINLFAIGLFGWVIVPLNLLAGLCYLIIPTVADGIWMLVSAIVARLHELITWLTTLPALKDAWLFTPVNTGMLLMALLVMLPWLLPRGLVSRWLALPPLTLLMVTVYAHQQALSLTPTLYILPTGDQYLTAAVLQYPINNRQIDDNDSNKKLSAMGNVSWLFLANHRPHGTRTMPSSLTAGKLSATLEQQLRTLSITQLEGMVVQTSVAALTGTTTKPLPNKKAPVKNTAKTSDLLPMTVAQLSQSFPTSQYWQAGRHERWSALKQSYLQGSPANAKTLISAQGCEQGKTWQLPNGDLTLQAITGWSTISDASVWDCALVIDSDMPINVVQYDATNPQQSASLTAQKLTAHQSKPPAATQAETFDQTLEPSLVTGQQDANRNAKQTKHSQSRLILDASTHPRVWQLWSLLCNAKPFAVNNRLDNSVTWLSHSASQVSAEVLTTHNANEVITYDNKPLEVALVLGTEPQTE